jgi:hypothetical protein
MRGRRPMSGFEIRKTPIGRQNPRREFADVARGRCNVAGGSMRVFRLISDPVVLPARRPLVAFDGTEWN